ncbi:MAG: hypothetical protein NTU73_05410, partial [Ignavibacteriae bacterium]|nr:hypothetical protein [Ignavibacteriota bacterium]
MRNKKAEIDDKKEYLVIRTWVDHRNYKSGRFVDPYFNELPEYYKLKKQNVLIFAGVLSNYAATLKKFNEDKDYLIVPVNFFLKSSDILRCLFATFFKRPRLRMPIFFRGFDVKVLIYEELRHDVITNGFLNALIQYYCCLRLTQSISINRFIYTFENYAWEKMSILGLRNDKKKNMKIIGFQHAFIAKNSFKYFLGEKESSFVPMPDKIITMGMKTFEILQRIGKYPVEKLSIGCALRQGYLTQYPVLPRRKNSDIFVPLTITVEDTIKVITFLFKARLGQIEQKIYLRFHPAT